MSTATIPFFGTQREFACHRQEIMAHIEKTLASGQALQGPEVADFECRMAALSGRGQGVAVNSCTDALFFALRAAGIQPGDEILVTDFSFIASASCIGRLGAKPVFVDVDETYNMDLEKAALLISAKTRGLVFVHLYGLMSDPKDVEAFTDRHDLILIEDAAQAVGATFQSRAAGSLGKISCISFDPTKPLSAPGSGGIALTDDSEAAAQIRRLRYHGKTGGGEFSEMGYNSQMPSLTAAVLNVKLKLNAVWMGRRRSIAEYYMETLSDLDIGLPVETKGAVHIYHKFVIRTPDRDSLKAFLSQKGIQTMIHYQLPLHRQPCFSSSPYRDADYPNTMSFSKTVLSLPIHPFLTDAEVEVIAHTVRKWRLENRRES